MIMKRANVIPNNDLKEHTEDETCDCQPSMQYGNNTLIIIHNSYDNREFMEKLYEMELN